MSGKSADFWSQDNRDAEQELSVEELVKHELANKELLNIRDQVNELDLSITKLLVARLTLTRQLTSIKADLGMPILDEGREAAVIERVGSVSGEPDLADNIKAIYLAIMAESRKLQSASVVVTDSIPGTGEQTYSPNPFTNAIDSAAKTYFPCVVIIGLGLMGGALARQIRRKMAATEIIGIDQSEVLVAALSAGIIDAAHTQTKSIVGRAKLIILSANPSANLKILAEIAPQLSLSQVVVDITSAKLEICQLAEKLDLHGADFIGGHPFFGSEKSGFSASAELDPAGKLFCLSPIEKTSEISLKRLTRWLQALDMSVEIVPPAQHDAIAAKVSHLVQLLAVALGADIASGLTDEELRHALSISGTSMRQLSRLMSSPSEMWSEIIAQNKDQVCSGIQSLNHRLILLRKAIKEEDADVLKTVF